MPASHPSPALTLRRIGLLAGLNILTGWLGLQLALPPGYVSAVFPPAGLALGAVLLWGPRVVAGVFLGSLGLNLLVALQAGPRLDTSGLLLALLIAIASSLQCLAGRALVERWLPGAKSLEIPEKMIPLLLLGGPLASLVASLAGSLAVVIVRHHDWSTWPFSFWSWWVGDSIGVLLFTPALLLLARFRQPEWRQQALTVLGPSLTLLVLMVALFFQSSEWERQRIDSSFRSQARTVVENLQRDIDHYQEAVSAVHRLFESSGEVTLVEFHRFTRPLTDRYPGIRALEFVPRVTAARREAMELQARREGLAGYRIRERDRAGNLVPAGPRTEYFPVYLVEPLADNERALGFDLGSNAERRATLQQARASNRPSATPPIRLVQQGDERPKGVLLIEPINSDPPTPQGFRGVALGVFRLDTVVRRAIPQEISRDIVLRLTDTTVAGKPAILFSSASQPDTYLDLEWTVPLQFANRRWRLQLFASEAFVSRQRSSVSWLVLAGGLLFTGVLQMLLLVITGHTRSIARQVATRTRQLADSEARLRAIFNDNPDAILVVNTEGRIVGSNARTQSLFGYTPEQLDQASIEMLLPERLRNRHVRLRDSFFEAPQLRAVGTGQTLQCRRADGQEFPVEIMLSPMHLPEQTLVIAIVRDITERHRLEQAREESEARFRSVAESASDALISTDSSGRIVYANPAAEHLFGYPAAQLLEMPVQTLLPGQSLPEHLLDSSSPMRELIGQRRDGSRFPCEISLANWTLGGAGYVTAFIRDITQRRQQEERLGNMLREKETLLKEVYHRVKNNLQVIQSLLNLESRTLPAGPGRTALADTGTRVRAMALVHEKLYQSGDLSRISLRDYVQDLLRHLAESGGVDSRRIALNADISGDLEVGLDTAISLGLLLNELVSNSIKHGFPGGRTGHVQVGIQRQGDRTVMSVADDGVGLPADFDLERSTTMGLKLAVSLARQLGGRLELRRERGSCFHALLTLQ